jgi:hypothetical protein
MKKLYWITFILSAFIILSCSDNPVTTVEDGGIGGNTGGGGTTGTVTFQVSLVYDDQQNYYFEFKPSVDVVITLITVNCAAANVNNEQIQADGTTVYKNAEPAYIQIPDPNVLAQGQQWSFTIAGKIGTSTGTAYSVTASYVVQ